MTDMREVVTVADHGCAAAIIRLPKARGVHEVAPLARHYLESPAAEREIARLSRGGWLSRLLWK